MIQGAAVVKVAGDMMWHNIKRAIGVFCVFAVVGLIFYMGYVTFWKPHHNPTPTKAYETSVAGDYKEDITHNYSKKRHHVELLWGVVKLW